MNLRESLNPDLIGALPDGRMSLPKPAFETVHAAASRLLALTETGEYRFCEPHTALESVPGMGLCNVANWVIDGGGSPTSCEFAPVLVIPADYLTEEGP